MNPEYNNKLPFVFDEIFYVMDPIKSLSSPKKSLYVLTLIQLILQPFLLNYIIEQNIGYGAKSKIASPSIYIHPRLDTNIY